MAFGSIKNVGIAAVDSIVQKRKEGGDFTSFTDFCERMQEEAVNKKCIESLIKAGAFDDFEQTRSTLMASFEGIIDSISDTNKKTFKGQVTMFDLGDKEEQMEKMKYNYTTLKEYSTRDLLSMEKEMLGIYISGHPLEPLRVQIEAQANINTLEMRNIKENILNGIPSKLKDGDMVRYAGIINSIKKKYTKTNKIMAFLTIEDLYGQVEVIVFENAYNSSSNSLLDDNIVLIEGRLSIREDEDPKIVANTIKEFGVSKKKDLRLDIRNLEEQRKETLRGILKFFNGDKNNTIVEVIDIDAIKPCGRIYLTEEILLEFEEILGKDRVNLEEI